MTAVITLEKLTKSYGNEPRDHRRRPRGRAGRDLRLPRSQRRGQDDDDPDDARPDPADQRPGARLRHRVDGRPGRDPPADRLHPRRVRALRPPDRQADPRVLRQPARRRRPGVPGVAGRAVRPRPEPSGSRTTARATSRRSGVDRRAPAPARAAGPRRADVRPRPARPADVLRDAARGGRRRRDRLPLVATSCPRSRRPATGSRSSATAGSSKLDTVDGLRDLAHHQVELRFAGPVPAATFEAIPGVS